MLVKLRLLNTGLVPRRWLYQHSMEIGHRGLEIGGFERRTRWCVSVRGCFILSKTTGIGHHRRRQLFKLKRSVLQFHLAIFTNNGNRITLRGLRGTAIGAAVIKRFTIVNQQCQTYQETVKSELRTCKFSNYDAILPCNRSKRFSLSGKNLSLPAVTVYSKESHHCQILYHAETPCVTV